MATVYFDLPNVTNGTGTSASPKNQTGWNAQVFVAGDTYLFKRGTASASAAFTLTAGTAGNVIRWGSWYNADGSDDTTVARPILNSTTQLSSYSSTNKDYTYIENIELRNIGASKTSVNDFYMIFMGTGSTVTGCIIDSDNGGIGIWGKSNVSVTNNSIFGCRNASSNCVLIVTDAVSMDNITISNNAIYHYGGGTNTSHATRIETTLTSGALTGLTVSGNTITTSTGALNANLATIGMRLSRCPAAEITNNTITYFLEGIFMNGGGAATACNFRTNNCHDNRHFGIHLTTDAIGCLLEYNTCSFNGTSTNDGVTLFAYGRGIELSSAAGQARCSGHTIRFNTCNNNYNYGGPLDNASEGVGIGLDDSVTGCLVYGNTLKNNEGSGIQYYGGTPGSGSPAITDTGGNHVVANFFDSNCTAAINNRRSGGTNLTLFTGHINMAVIFGSVTYVAHNIFVGTTPVGIHQNVSCTLVLVANNVFKDVPHALSFNNTISTGSVNSNVFHSNAVTIQKFCLGGIDASGSPTYVTKTYTGTNDLSLDPQLNATYFPNPGSVVISAGFAYAAGQLDFVGRPFNPAPSIGMYEALTASSALTPPGGRLRKLLQRRR